MKSLAKDDDIKFSRMIKRDAKILILIIILSWIGVFFIPLIAYLGHKYNW